MAAASLALCAIAIVLDFRLMWCWVKLEQHGHPLFCCYMTWMIANVFTCVAPITVLAQPGRDLQTFSPSITFCLVMSHMCWSIGFGVFAPLNYLDQCAETVHSFNLREADRWKWRARFIFAPLCFGYIVIGFTTSALMLSSSEVATRKQGALAIWLVIAGVMCFMAAVAAFAKRELKAVRARLGAATAVKLDTDLRVQKVCFVMSVFMCLLCVVLAAAEEARSVTGAVIVLFVMPLLCTIHCCIASARLQAAQQELAHIAKSIKPPGSCTPVSGSGGGGGEGGGGRKGAKSKGKGKIGISHLSHLTPSPPRVKALSATIVERASEISRLPAGVQKRTVPVAEAGVSLALLRLLASENRIRRGVTMREVCDR
jgi:hypothetical protein